MKPSLVWPYFNYLRVQSDHKKVLKPVERKSSCASSRRVLTMVAVTLSESSANTATRKNGKSEANGTNSL